MQLSPSLPVTWLPEISSPFWWYSALEGAESTLIMASGMCASTVMLMALVPAGGHIVTTTDCYRKTRIFIETILPKMGITVKILLLYASNILILWAPFLRWGQENSLLSCCSQGEEWCPNFEPIPIHSFELECIWSIPVMVSGGKFTYGLLIRLL